MGCTSSQRPNATSGQLTPLEPRPAELPTQASDVTYTDSDGDTIKFTIEDGKLIKYVNNRRQVGESCSSGVVTRLRYQAGNPACVFDQHDWGGDIPLSLVPRLKQMADEVCVPSNLPTLSKETLLPTRQENSYTHTFPSNLAELSIEQRDAIITSICDKAYNKNGTVKAARVLPGMLVKMYEKHAQQSRHATPVFKDPDDPTTPQIRVAQAFVDAAMNEMGEAGDDKPICKDVFRAILEATFADVLGLLPGASACAAEKARMILKGSKRDVATTLVANREGGVGRLRAKDEFCLMPEDEEFDIDDLCALM